MRRVEGLDEVEVEVPRRHGGGALVGRAEEQVSLPRGLVLQPFEFVLPDLVARDVGLVGALHDPLQGLVVVAVELRGSRLSARFSIRASKSSVFLRSR